MANDHDEEVTHTQILTVIEDVKKTLETVAEQVAATAEKTTEHSEILGAHTEKLDGLTVDMKDIKAAVKGTRHDLSDHANRIESLERAA